MQDSFSGQVGVSAWNGLVAVRLVAPEGAALRRDLIGVLTALNTGPLPRLWLN
jgi:urease accessory protein